MRTLCIDAHTVRGELEGRGEFGAWTRAELVMNCLACESTRWISSHVAVRMREFQKLILLERVEYRLARRRIEAPQSLHLRFGEL